MPSGFGGTAGPEGSRGCICPQGLLAAVTLECDEAGVEGVRTSVPSKLAHSHCQQQPLLQWGDPPPFFGSKLHLGIDVAEEKEETPCSAIQFCHLGKDSCPEPQFPTL